MSIVRWLVAPLLALAALLLLAVLNRGEEWVVTGIAVGDSAIVGPADLSEWVADGFFRARGAPALSADGRQAPLTDRAALARLFRTARHLETNDSTQVTLQLGDLLGLEIDRGTRIGVPNTPGRYVDNELELTLIYGTLRIVEGPGLGGRRVVALTPDARLEIVNGVIALHRDSLSSRVDVYEGEVRIGSSLAGEPLTVRSGGSAIVGPGSRPVAASVSPEERSRLARLRGRGLRSRNQLRQDVLPR
jgi:hypothetical protein